MTARNELDASRRSPAVNEKMATYHGETIGEVTAAIAKDDLVVVGMAQNPHVRRVRKALDGAGIPFTYLEYGSYFSDWSRRLAIKIWSGYPTFPQVYVKGVLLGGADNTESAIADGSLKTQLAAPRPG